VKPSELSKIFCLFAGKSRPSRFTVCEEGVRKMSAKQQQQQMEISFFGNQPPFLVLMQKKERK
jgi:hypothetical protein